MKHRILLPVCALLLLASPLLGCAPKQGAAARKGTQSPTRQTATPSGARATESSDSGEDEALSFAEVKALEKLDTYRLQFKWRYENDQGEKGSMEALEEVVKNPPASHQVYRYTDSKAGAQDKPFEIIRVGDVVYSKSGDEWMAMQQTEAMLPFGALLSPDLYFGADEGKYVGKETVNGMDTKHYRYDAKTLNPALRVSKLSEYKADVWVSTEYKVYIRALVHIVGVDESNVKQTYEWESNTLDINKPLTIKPPEGVKAPKLPDDIPLMEGAKADAILSTSSHSVLGNFSVAKPREEVEKFYKEQMKAKEWVEAEGGMPGMMNYEKNGRQVMIVINETKDGVTTFLISVEEAQAGGATSKPAATEPAAPTESAVTEETPTPEEQAELDETPAPAADLIADIPVMDGAMDVEQGDDYIYYTVSKSLADVADFYRVRFTDAGWTQVEASEDGTVFTYTKDERTASVLLGEADEDKTTVEIMVASE